MLKLAFNEAMKKKIITENPMLNVRKPRSKQKKIKVRALTLEEQKKLLNVLKTEKVQYGEQMLISMFTGMRIGEVNALEVKDVDFKKLTISVNKTVSRGMCKKTTVSDSAKTKAGTRTVYINNEVAELLKRCIGEKKSGYIFTSSTGTIITTQQVNTHYTNVLNQYNIINKKIEGKVTLHSLRHTYATRCIESGMPAKVLQYILGHTDIRITLDTYCDVFESFSNENIIRADAYLKEHQIAI